MRRLLLVLGITLVALSALSGRPGNPVPLVEAAQTSNFVFTGAEQQFVVPPGRTRVLISAAGATGAAGASCAPNLLAGTASEAVFAVTPGQTLFVNVGGTGVGPVGGFNGGADAGPHPVAIRRGGGGGGFSDVRTISRANPGTLPSILVAGGGSGGQGGCGNGGAGNPGGRGGNIITPGQAGTGAVPGQPGQSGAAGGGGGAGAPGEAGGTPGTPWLGGPGGAGRAITTQGGSGGGGGGGATGGGGGGAGDATATGSGGGGGGGGSNFVAPSAVASSGPVPSATAFVNITVLDPPTITKAFAPATIQVGGTSNLTITLANPNNAPLPFNFNNLTGVALTDDFSALGLVIAGAPTGAPLCTGTITATNGSSILSLAGGTLAGGATCTITVPVTASTTGTKVNTTGNISATETGPGNTATATLLVTAAPVTSTPTATPTPTPTLVHAPSFIPPVIPQVFQHVPQGIFNGSRNNTPTPVVRAVVAAAVDPVMPVLRPPSTGDAGLKTDAGLGYAPVIAATAVLLVSGGAALRLRKR